MDIPKANQIKIVVTFSFVALIIIILLIYRDPIFKIQNNLTDNLKFQREYINATEDNVFKYISIEDTISMLKEGTGIIYFGFKSCSWCQAYVPILNEVAKENNIDQIYYYDIKSIRTRNTKEYQEIVSILSDYLENDENGNKRVYVPDVYFVKNGKIQGHNNDTSTIEGADTKGYYTDKVKSELKAKLMNLINKVYSNCSDTTKSGC